MASCCRSAKEAKRESTAIGPNWVELPRDLTLNILQRLGTIEIVTSACLVCPPWWNICKDPLMWRTIQMTNLRYSPYNFYELAKICRYAVERICGHLEDIHIEYFATDDLLKCIADSANDLRRMRLVHCVGYSYKGFREVAEELPMLEELDISHSIITNDTLETIGRSCPLLKSLKFKDVFCKHLKCDDKAFAIAKTMPGLRHLKIFGDLLSNDGLLAILDGCPLLESLDLRDCLHLLLRGSLGKRCFEQIKDLRLPTPYNNYVWTV